MKELEVLQYKQIQGLSLFINVLRYRNPHFHNAWELIWVLEGTLVVSIGNSSQSVEKGQLFLIPPSKVHEFHCARRSCIFLCLQMSPIFINLPDNTVTEDYLISSFADKTRIEKIKKSALKVSYHYFSHSPLAALICAAECNSIMYEILNSIAYRILSADEAESRKKTELRLSKLISYVEKNYMKKILLNDFARQENLSMNYLSHFIKSTMNQSFQDYVASIRVQAASKLISTKKLKATTVSRMAGFSDYKYFVKNFRKHFGATPEEFAKQKAADIQQGSNAINSNADERILLDSESLDIVRNIKNSI
jgi:AraC-like DNA-binding protein